MAVTDYPGVTTSYDPKRPTPYGVHYAYIDEHGKRAREGRFRATAAERDALVPVAAAELSAHKARVAHAKQNGEVGTPLPAAPRGTDLFETLARRFLAEVMAPPRHKASTYEGYEVLLRKHLFPVMGKWPVTDQVMTVKALTDVLGKTLHARGLNIKRRLACQRVLSPFFNWVLRTAQVPAKVFSQNPVRGLGLNLRQDDEFEVDLEPEPNPMTAAQRDAFLAWVKEHRDLTLYRLFVWMVFQGSRVGEACALQWPRIKFAEEQAHIVETFSAAQRRAEIRAEKAGRPGKEGIGLQATKGRHARQFIHLHPTVLAELPLQRQDNLEHWMKLGRRGAEPTFCFLNATNTHPLRSHNERIYEAFHAACEALQIVGDTGQPFKVHALRATFITQAIKDGHPIGMIARHVGHKGEATINKHYYRWIQEGEDNPFRPRRQASDKTGTGDSHD